MVVCCNLLAFDMQKGLQEGSLLHVSHYMVDKLVWLYHLKWPCQDAHWLYQIFVRSRKKLHFVSGWSGDCWGKGYMRNFEWK